MASLFSIATAMNNHEPVRDDSIDVTKIISVIKETDAECSVFRGLPGTDYYTANLPNNVQLVAQFHSGMKFCTQRTITKDGVIVSTPVAPNYFDAIKLYYDLLQEKK